MSQLFYLVDGQEFDNSIPLINRYFYYNNDETEVSALSVAQAFASSVLPLILGVQGGVMTHPYIFAADVYNPANSAALALTNAVGQRSGDEQPSFGQFSFTCHTIGNALKAGGKRIAGLTDDTVSGNSPTGFVATELANLAEGLSVPIQVGAAILQYVIAKQTGPAQWLLASVISAIYRAISTQDSRKEATTVLWNPFQYTFQGALTYTHPVDEAAHLAAIKAAVSGTTIRAGAWTLDMEVGDFTELYGVDLTLP